MSSRVRILTCRTNLVRLLIIDEIHLFFMASVVLSLRVLSHIQIWHMERSSDYGHLVGLSGTLLATRTLPLFLHIDQSKGPFYFDALCHPCALQWQFIRRGLDTYGESMIIINKKS